MTKNIFKDWSNKTRAEKNKIMREYNNRRNRFKRKYWNTLTQNQQETILFNYAKAMLRLMENN